ncbi:hypothetical protein TVAG_212250 [Trichomonas vaginalis G3]|uniref:Uncharacterized protein n=1 Tax=Trichomonas vaginalis (strain ATCC PRA-98 / G3) TaxID=412133 RepID=A2E2L5_TRIV3|nr:box H/ACA snoRNP assembly [Trichomonas vaginalis G3]EAY13043.1 hypothetical protein TVAG_212250 [Trichomonas vaginalis G3]KAI5548232.1 box H/ACA snoRNP assembly [Trichomonas vaginalis G3]|eukprot:XP_001325266.1 hypothetical protein [Trichomonas vaginalis G3]
MPLTPDFWITQDSDFLHFTIKCPNVRAKDMELVVADTEFNFNAEPYMLILHFQHSLRDGEGCTASYDIDAGMFTATIKKAIPGEDFPEILLLTTLKAPQPQKKELFEVVSRSTALEWTDDAPDISHYGFNFWAIDFFENMGEILPYVAEISDPDHTILPARTKMRIEKENDDYDPDRVIFDHVNPYPIKVEHLNNLLTDFTPEERKKLLDIKRQEFLMCRDVAKSSFYSIAEVCYSSVMDIVCFGPEGSCQSNWTIAQLSPTLSWFDSFPTAREMIIATVRRTMVYNVSRSFSLAETVWKETEKFIKAGRTPIIKALIRAKSALEKAEHRWRLNKLYIDPMISWIQELKEEEFQEFSKEVCNEIDNFVTKDEVDYDWAIELCEKYAVQLKENGELDQYDQVNDLDVLKEMDPQEIEEEDFEHNYEPVDIYSS